MRESRNPQLESHSLCPAREFLNPDSALQYAEFTNFEPMRRDGAQTPKSNGKQQRIEKLQTIKAVRSDLREIFDEYVGAQGCSLGEAAIFSATRVWFADASNLKFGVTSLKNIDKYGQPESRKALEVVIDRSAYQLKLLIALFNQGDAPCKTEFSSRKRNGRVHEFTHQMMFKGPLDTFSGLDRMPLISDLKQSDNFLIQTELVRLFKSEVKHCKNQERSELAKFHRQVRRG